MALSEDAIAIVASNLAAAHCSLAGFWKPDEDGSGPATEQEAVEQMYAAYLVRVGRNQIKLGEAPPPPRQP